jgi:putative sterol carrier protein
MQQITSVKDYFDTLSQRFQAGPAKGVKATFQFELSGDGGGTYHVKVEDGTMSCGEGPSPDNANTTIKMKGEDYVKMVNGQISGTMAFLKGQLKIAGDMMLAQKMQQIFPPNK